jgi:hypothetical protein
VFYGETVDGVTPRGYSDAETLLNHENVPRTDVIEEFRIQKDTSYRVFCQTTSGRRWSIEGIGVPLLLCLEGVDDILSLTKGPDTPNCRQREGPIREIVSSRPGTAKTLSDLVDFLMTRTSVKTLSGGLADDLCVFLSGKTINALVDEQVDREFGEMPKTDLRGMLFFSETRHGPTPRGYYQSDLLMQREGINPAAVIQRLWVLGGQLDDQDGQPVNELVRHHWVVFRDSDGLYWSAENAVLILLQRLGTWSHRELRKAFWDTKCRRRSGIETPGGIVQLFATDAARRRTMGEVVNWMKDQSQRGYHPTFNNCQHFAHDLSQFLSEKGAGGWILRLSHPLCRLFGAY